MPSRPAATSPPDAALVSIPPDFLGELSGYCDAPGCPAREFTVTVKHSEARPSVIRVRCPLCGTSAIRDWVHGWLRDSVAVDRQAQAEALDDVALRAYIAGHPETWGVPAGVFLSPGPITVTLEGCPPVRLESPTDESDR